MEFRPWILSGLLLTLLATPVGAVDFDDPEGDVAARVLNQWQENAPGWDGVDLVTFILTEDPSTFRFTVEVAGFTGPASAKHDAATYLVTFTHGGRDHAVSLVRNGLEDAWYGNLYEVDPTSGNLRWVGPLDARGGDEQRGGWVEAPRHHFLDRLGAAPGAGDLLEDLTLTAFAHASGFSCCVGLPGVNQGPLVQAVDVVEVGDYGVLYGGDEATGPVRLTATHPYRASNGGATTLRYEVQAVNAGDNGTFRLEARDVPEGWSVTLPQRLQLDGGGRATVDVLAETPFVHQHGTSSEFRVVLTREDDDSVRAATTLGVHYLATPQPSGHHPRLWLHAVALGEAASTANPVLGGTDGRLYMNALEDDPADEGVEVTMSQWGVGNGDFRLYACLEPGLLMGLDLDLDGTGRVELPVRSDVPTQGSLSGRVLHLSPGDELRSCFPSAWGDRTATALASFQGDAAAVGSSPSILEAEMTPLEEGDRVPYEAGAQLVLELIVRTGSEGGLGKLRATPGGLLDLPLEEYRDSRPAGLVGDSAVVSTANGTVVAGAQADVGKDSPGPGLAALLAGVVVVAVVRRRA